MTPLSIEYNGLVLSPANGYSIQELEGTTGLELRNSEEERTGAHGSRMNKQLYGPRFVSFAGKIRGANVTEYYERENALLEAFSLDPDSDSPKELKVTLLDGRVGILEAFVCQMPMPKYTPGILTTNEYRIVMIAPYPFYLEPESQAFELQPARIGGTPIPTPIDSPAVGAGEDDFSFSFISHSGPVPGKLQLTFHGPSTRATITNFTTGEQFYINTDLTSSDIVEIGEDEAGSYVLKNGNYMREIITGDIFDIYKNGLNKIGYSQSSALQTSYVTGSYRRRSLFIQNWS